VNEITYRIPIGPYHPALEEPIRFTVSCTGEVIESAEIEVGYVLRSIELLAQRRNYAQDVVLTERVCGICSGIHSTTFCMAAEALAGVRIPDRARYLRVIMAELERLHSHLLWAGVGADVIGFRSLFMEIYYLRERVMDALEAVSGNRVNYGMQRIGGLNRDILQPAMLREAMRDISKGLVEKIVPVFTGDRLVRARTEGIGVLTREQAEEYGVVGPTARASGMEIDTRRDTPYAAYRDLDFQPVFAREGDVRARIVVRAKEMLESARLIEQALRDMPEGAIRIGDPLPAIPAGEVIVRTEAPRGEVIYYLRSDGSDTPERVKIRTPTFMNIPAICVREQLSNMPIIQASVDPCRSCTDR
jgi:Ni,Fe-hydrogenase III large subunit